MITAGDDYPLHQGSRPVRDPGTERNLYDRFFFNGYSRDASVFFAVALGLYPGRDVMDGAFSVQVDGVQHNLRASRRLGEDRLDTRVGPLSVRVVEPLRRLEVSVDDTGGGSAGSGISASLSFDARAPVFEEPHYLWKPGHRTVFDLTRMTQGGSWSGEIRIGDHRLALDPSSTWGTRDRSWGVRPVGEPDPPGAPGALPGFFWLWAPLNFEDSCYLFDVNENPDGSRWHESATWSATGSTSAPVVKGSATYRLMYRPGTRHASRAEITFSGGGEKDVAVALEPVSTFFMQGLGYSHPEWGHGMWLGEDVRRYDTLVLAEADETAPFHQHVQALCRAERDGASAGIGVLEQLIIGPHEPSGLSGILDMHT